MNLAPIALFTYNRPWHTQQTVEALQKNKLASESELFIYSDEAKNDDARVSVDEVRKYIDNITGFKKITVIKRDKNWGLANSIKDGVTKIVNEYGRIIVLEDDLVTSSYFLKFMNEALEFYKDEEKVMHISGFSFPIEKNKHMEDVFFIKPTSCWGWATWDQAWGDYNNNIDYYMGKFTNRMIYDFNLNNTNKYFDQIIQNKAKKINTWAIFWYASVYLKGGLSLHPKDSYVRNIGHDGSGIHCGSSSIYDVDLMGVPSSSFTKVCKENNLERVAYENYFQSIKTSFIKRVIGRILKLFKELR